MEQDMEQENIDEAGFATLLEKGKNLEQRGFYDEALKKFEKLSILNPGDSVPAERIQIIKMIQEAFDLRQKGDLDNAVNKFSEVLEIDLSNTTALSFRGLSYVGCDEEFAKADIQEALLINPEDPRALIAASDCYLYKLDYHPAVKCIEKAKISGKDYNPSIQALIFRQNGLYYNLIGSYSLGLSSLEKSYLLNPEDSWTLLWLADAKFGLGDFQGAIASYSDAIKKLSRPYWFAYYKKALAYLSNAEYRQAIEAFDLAAKCVSDEDSLEKSKLIANIVCGKGFALINTEKGYDEALQSFESVLRTDTYNVAALFGKIWAGRQAQKEYQIQEKVKDVQTQLLNSSNDVISHTSQYLKILLWDFKTGLDLVKNMFFVQFILGVSLLVGAVIAALYDEDLVTAILGVTGGISLLIAFIRDSPMHIQKNRVDFSQWMMGYFNWYNSFLETNILLGQKASRKEAISIDELLEIQKELNTNTENTIKLIEECCEFKQNPRQKGFVKETSDKITSASQLKNTGFQSTGIDPAGGGGNP